MTPPPPPLPDPKTLPAAVAIALGLQSCCLPLGVDETGHLGPCLSIAVPPSPPDTDTDTDTDTNTNTNTKPKPKPKPGADGDTGKPPIGPCLSIAPPPEPEPDPLPQPASCLSEIPPDGNRGADMVAPDRAPAADILDALPADVRERLLTRPTRRT